MKGFSAFLDMISSPSGSDSKESACNAGDLGLIPVGKIPWRGEWLPIPYSCLENPMDRRFWWATVHGVAKSQTQLSDQHTQIWGDARIGVMKSLPESIYLKTCLLDLIECLKNYGQRFVTSYRRQWSRPSPRKRNARTQNAWAGPTNSWEKKRSKR